MKRNLVGKILGKIKIFVQDFVPIRTALTPVFMATKSCTKILNFSTRSLCENLAAEDFVTLPMGKKSCTKILNLSSNKCWTFRTALLLREWWYFQNNSAARACAARRHTQPPTQQNQRPTESTIPQHGSQILIFPVQLTTSRIGNLTRLIHTLLYVMTIHTTAV